MHRILQRLARIQRIRRDEARHELRAAELVFEEHHTELRRCHEASWGALQDAAGSADELMRRHAFSLRQEMLRRRLQATAQHLEARVEDRRDALKSAVREVQTTERMADRFFERALRVEDRRDQRKLDEVGLMAWARRNGGDR